MTILAIDTAHEFGSLALSYGEEMLEEVPLHSPAGFSEILFAQIAELLARNHVEPRDIDIYAAGAGPGSFTGVRIALSAVKALAFANGKACFGISNLAAMAAFGTAPCRAAFIDARRGEIYGAVSGFHVTPEVVAPFSAWLESLPPDVSEFLAFDFTPFAPVLDQSPFSAADRTGCTRWLASSIANLALEAFRLGDPGDPAAVDANYVRRSDAELLWKDR